MSTLGIVWRRVEGLNLIPDGTEHLSDVDANRGILLSFYKKGIIAKCS